MTINIELTDDEAQFVVNNRGIPNSVYDRIKAQMPQYPKGTFAEVVDGESGIHHYATWDGSHWCLAEYPMAVVKPRVVKILPVAGRGQAVVQLPTFWGPRDLRNKAKVEREAGNKYFATFLEELADAMNQRNGI